MDSLSLSLLFVDMFSHPLDPPFLLLSRGSLGLTDVTGGAVNQLVYMPVCPWPWNVTPVAELLIEIEKRRSSSKGVCE